jgi:hypothetical protein
MRIEAFGEVFNLFNAINPSFAQGSTGAVAAGRLFTGTTLANQQPNPVFMKPLGYAGDSGLSEQRIGQIGFRFTF